MLLAVTEELPILEEKEAYQERKGNYNNVFKYLIE